MKIFIHLMEKAGRLVFQLIHVIVNNKELKKKLAKDKMNELKNKLCQNAF